MMTRDFNGWMSVRSVAALLTGAALLLGYEFHQAASSLSATIVRFEEAQSEWIRFGSTGREPVFRGAVAAGQSAATEGTCAAHDPSTKSCSRLGDAALRAESSGVVATVRAQTAYGGVQLARIESSLEGEYLSVRRWLRNTLVGRTFVVSSHFRRSDQVSDRVRAEVGMAVDESEHEVVTARAEVPEEGRGIFSSLRKEPVLTEQIRKTSEVVLPPQPPPFNYRYFGRVKASQSRLFLERDGQLIEVTEGLELKDGYHIERVDDRHLVIGHRATGKRLTFELPPTQE